ncbi:MAG: YabP/YqfC family sporulation protein [Oscillospiraceae bacterium]|nr:YabP/YqfC family sporulation protein [Oscillospiraceae bacterium]
MQEQNKKNISHNIILESRSKLSISGITDVDHFDESTVRLYTQMGEMTISGKDLHVNDLSVQSGEMNIEGDIWSITYGDKDRTSPLSLLGKLFR